jgi:hypothetical protein
MLDQGSGLQVLRKELTNKKHAVQEARRGTSRRLHRGKTNTFCHFLFTFCAGREGESNAEGRGTIEELEQTLFELRGEIRTGRHVLPAVWVLPLSANPAQDWADLRNAALDRLKEENAALLQRLSALEASGTYSIPPATDAMADRPSITTKLVPRAS